MSLQALEALFRFLFNADKKSSEKVISTVLFMSSVGIFLLGFSLFILDNYIKYIQFIWLIFFHYSTAIIYELYQKITHSFGKNTYFAFSGVIHTIVLLVTQIITILLLGLRVEGLLLANIVSNIVCIVYLETKTKARTFIKIKGISRDTAIEVINFSFPLVP